MTVSRTGRNPTGADTVLMVVSTVVAVAVSVVVVVSVMVVKTVVIVLSVSVVVAVSVEVGSVVVSVLVCVAVDVMVIVGVVVWVTVVVVVVVHGTSSLQSKSVRMLSLQSVASDAATMEAQDVRATNAVSVWDLIIVATLGMEGGWLDTSSQ